MGKGKPVEVGDTCEWLRAPEGTAVALMGIWFYEKNKQTMNSALEETT